MLARLLRLHPSTYKRSLSLERHTQNRLPDSRASSGATSLLQGPERPTRR